ncbi:MepB protein [Staphylococcus nepalensis]|uniref:MepB protein n=1 Tax=Staphylococcus nepalensis TaxID=214473 RepID=A0A2T4S7M2_9STAP|nr:MepB protein [Staphylococcus nepalensis]
MISNYNSYFIFKKISEILPRLSLDEVELEEWNQSYESFNFIFNRVSFKSRMAKKTPKKSGYFVAVWHKNSEYENEPFDFYEMKDKLIVNILDGNQKGQFIFSKEILAKKNIIRTDYSIGKMAFRVYPDWETNLNKAATLTQKWQSQYFIDLSDGLSEQEIKAQNVNKYLE